MKHTIINWFSRKPTLKYILEFAQDEGACHPQLDKFTEFIEKGDTLQAWQTVLGNVGWLRKSGLRINQEYLEINAQNVGKKWWAAGNISEEATYKNGELNGIRRSYHYNGNIWLEQMLINDELHGVSRFFGENGELHFERTYKNGKLINEEEK